MASVFFIVFFNEKGQQLDLIIHLSGFLC
jgi:hypothetical protein